ncbi:MAG: helix-turn-helix domain-containing protein [Terriglobales bacterium]
MESFGARLKREREQRKITLDDIAVSTKIGTRFLVAIEEDHFDQLPGGIFNKGFVRAYARYLGIDETQAIADFVVASGPSLPESPPPDAPDPVAMPIRAPKTAGKSTRGDGIPWGVVALVLLVLAFAFALWGFYGREKSARPSVAVPPVGADTSPAAGQGFASGAAGKPSSLGTSSPASPSPPPQRKAGSGETATPVAAPPDSAPNSGNFVVLIKAREDSWVAISADGKPVLEGTLAAQAEKFITARDRVVLKAGNVGALDISFNGKELASQGRRNQVRTLTFSRNGLQP